MQQDLSTVTIVTVTKVIKYCDLKSYCKVCNRKIIFEMTKVELQVHPSNQQQISSLSCGQTKLTKTALREGRLDLKSLDDMQIISTLLFLTDPCLEKSGSLVMYDIIETSAVPFTQQGFVENALL